MSVSKVELTECAKPGQYVNITTSGIRSSNYTPFKPVVATHIVRFSGLFLVDDVCRSFLAFDAPDFVEPPALKYTLI